MPDQKRQDRTQDTSQGTFRDVGLATMTARDWRRFVIITIVGVATGLVCIRMRIDGFQRLAIYLPILSLTVAAHDGVERWRALARRPGDKASRSDRS